MRRARATVSVGQPDLRILSRLAPDLWPPGRPDLRRRVVIALGLLVLAKLATVTTPFMFGWAVDALAPATGAPLAWVPVALVAAYCTVRFLSNALQQMRDMVFARVGQHALRKLARRVFAHVHRLSLGYHLERRTGELSRVTERGIKAIDFLLRYLVFSVVPLILEIGIVAIIFALNFGLWYVVA
ncbi:MAG: ABC transporter transmembrane domain-containing protein, partial [Pseudomonadota bacterium]